MFRTAPYTLGHVQKRLVNGKTLLDLSRKHFLRPKSISKAASNWCVLWPLCLSTLYKMHKQLLHAWTWRVVPHPHDPILIDEWPNQLGLIAIWVLNISRFTSSQKSIKITCSNPNNILSGRTTYPPKKEKRPTSKPSAVEFTFVDCKALLLFLARKKQLRLRPDLAGMSASTFQECPNKNTLGISTLLMAWWDIQYPSWN